jgi:hypothetical protein
MLRSVLLFFLVFATTSVSCAVADDTLKHRDDTALKLEIWADRMCAGLFWSVNQCGAAEFRAAHGRAFLTMARKAAALEGKRMPLTQDEAALQMPDELQGWLEEIGPACETFSKLPQSTLGHLVSLDGCVRRLRGKGHEDDD